MQTKLQIYADRKKNPTNFYDAVGGMPLLFFFCMHTIHKGLLTDQLKLNYVFFPSYSHLLISPCTWNELTGQYISFMTPCPLFKIKLYCKYHLPSVIADREEEIRCSLESFTQGTELFILPDKMY